jgi:protein phosphatase 1G
VSRRGEAVDMSFDHKPESDEETLRIIKAGGKVTDDGRVNGGLNLSRALGDHSYKQNTTLPPEEQMISPMPTVQYLELTPETDEFIVLACDGVWNSMSSQQVVDFVKERIAVERSLSNICEEVFFHLPIKHCIRIFFFKYLICFHFSCLICVWLKILVETGLDVTT